MKRNKQLHELIKNNRFAEKVRVFFSTTSKGDDYDKYEKTVEYTELNPLTIKAVVRMISPEALVWKQYGLSQMGAIEIVTEGKYKKWFELCTKVEYKEDTYNVFKDTTGSRAIIQTRPNDTIRVVLEKA